MKKLWVGLRAGVVEGGFPWRSKPRQKSSNSVFKVCVRCVSTYEAKNKTKNERFVPRVSPTLSLCLSVCLSLKLKVDRKVRETDLLCFALFCLVPGAPTLVATVFQGALRAICRG